MDKLSDKPEEIYLNKIAKMLLSLPWDRVFNIKAEWAPIDIDKFINATRYFINNHPDGKYIEFNSDHTKLRKVCHEMPIGPFYNREWYIQKK